MRHGEDPEPVQEHFSDADTAAIALLHDLTHWREQLARSIARTILPCAVTLSRHLSTGLLDGC